MLSWNVLKKYNNFVAYLVEEKENNVYLNEIHFPEESEKGKDELMWIELIGERDTNLTKYWWVINMK